MLFRGSQGGAALGRSRPQLTLCTRWTDASQSQDLRTVYLHTKHVLVLPVKLRNALCPISRAQWGSVHLEGHPHDGAFRPFVIWAVGIKLTPPAPPLCCSPPNPLATPPAGLSQVWVDRSRLLRFCHDTGNLTLTVRQNLRWSSEESRHADVLLLRDRLRDEDFLREVSLSYGLANTPAV